VQAAYQTARIMFTVPDRGHVSEGELADKLAAFAP